jgi:hypothetical protein
MRVSCAVDREEEYNRREQGYVLSPFSFTSFFLAESLSFEGAGE